MSDAKITPAMQRYLDVKAETPGAILLFRMGDFYELFYEDAETASKVLGITLTSRDKGSANPVPMAGFPYHALDGYLNKLIHAGYRVAVCEQVEDPKTAKGMVRREVTRIVTPGTLTDDALLDPKESNFLAAVFPSRDRVGVAWLELSTGRFQCAELALGEGAKSAARSAGDRVSLSFSNASLQPSALLDELARVRPAECLIPETHRADPALLRLNELPDMVLTTRAPWCFVPDHCRDVLQKHFQTSTLEGFDIEADSLGITAAGVLIEYVQETQKSSLGHIVRLEQYRRGSSLLIDEATRRSLELTRTMREGRREGSLLSVLDETATPMGARMLAEWLSNPLTDPIAIGRRLDAVEELMRDSKLGRELQELLKQAYDMQRLCARVATMRATARDLVSLGRTLSLLPRVKAKLAGRQTSLLQTLESRMELCGEIRAQIETTLVDEPPLQVSDGGIVRDGFHPGLDELRDLARGGKKWIAEYQAQEIERTGIPNLKVGFNKVFGYYLEVTASQMNKVPPEYIRKQTLKNQERFITPPLKEYEDKVLRAEERAIALENELFQHLRDAVNAECRRLQQTAEVLAQLDVLVGLAKLAVSLRYCRPEITTEPMLDIRDGRHPVLDKLRPTGEFVPNDVVLGGRETRDERREPAVVSGHEPSAISSEPATNDQGLMTNDQDTRGLTPPRSPVSPDSLPFIQLITGPNMAGKSTYIRQAALLTIMAQIGSFIPARSARIGIADRIFARVGASDELGKGQSTFMVEMTETARILNAATKHSLVILDEIGRGTSTYDGISLAWAITEFIHDELQCRTLFATHYHELTSLSESLAGTSNWNVAVHERNGELIFLHKIVPGAADKSYGIQVARLAGVPREVIDRSEVILQTLEADHQDSTGKTTIPQRKRRSKHKQLTLFGPEYHPLLDELRELDMDHMTPTGAFEALQKLRSRLGAR